MKYLVLLALLAPQAHADETIRWMLNPPAKECEPVQQQLSLGEYYGILRNGAGPSVELRQAVPGAWWLVDRESGYRVLAATSAEACLKVLGQK